MLTGTSLANAAILIVSAQPNERLRDETKLHLYLAGLLGIRNLVVAINKMDTVDFSKEEFEKIQGEISQILENFGFDKMSFVPVSAMGGDNVAEKSKNMDWYSGKTIIEFMEEFSGIDFDGKLELMPPRMFVQDVYDLGDEKMLVGRLDTGRLKVGQEMKVQPKGIVGKISQMIVRNKEVNEASAGENIGIKLDANGEFSRGDLCIPSESSANPSSSLNARIFCLPGNELSVSEKLEITCASSEAGSKISAVQGKMNPIKDKEMRGGESRIKGWEAAIVTVELEKPMVFEKFNEMPFTGRFIMTKEGKIAAVGVVV
jgi:sulfate adenylyltransferase subunit 1 (EFTu-like GTPase family)